MLISGRQLKILPVESAGGRSSRCGPDGVNRRDDAGTRLPRGQLRHHRAAARDDACVRLSVSGALFRMGGGRCFDVCAHTTAAVALSHAHVGNPLGAAGERHNLPDANAAGYRGDPARQTSVAAVSDCARDQREHWQRRHTGGESPKHDYRAFFKYSICAIFASGVNPLLFIFIAN